MVVSYHMQLSPLSLANAVAVYPTRLRLDGEETIVRVPELVATSRRPLLNNYCHLLLIAAGGSCITSP